MSRISTLSSERMGIAAILDQQYNLSKTQKQLATGKRIVTPSDDPADATRVLDLKKTEARNLQYQDNIVMAENRLEREEVALRGVIDSLQSVRELAVQALNDTQGPRNRASLAEEVRQRLDEVLGLANSKDASGEYIFSGFQSRTQAFVGDPFAPSPPGTNFVYQGDQGQRMAQISPTRQVATGDPGSDIFMNVADAGGGTRSMFAQLYDFATQLEADNPSDEILTNIDNALDQINSARAGVGARLQVLDSQRSINEDYDISLKSAVSDLQDLDYAEAISRMNLQLTGLQAAQNAYTKVQGLSIFNYI